MGDRVAFTGVGGDRDRQEVYAARRGLRVTGSVSGRTNVLVWDGEMAGDKLSKARTYGNHVVAPHEFDVLMTNLQRILDAAPSAPSPGG